MTESASTPAVLRRGAAEIALGLPRRAIPTYDGPCRLLDWKHSAKDGMTVDLKVEFPGPLGGHPFRGVAAGREHGQRFSVIVTLPRQVNSDGSVMEREDAAVVHSGETLLLRWAENDLAGMMVRLLLDDGPDGVQHGRHPFFGLAIGRRLGEPLEFIAWGIADDESRLSPSQLKQRTPFHQLTEVQQSQVLCRDPRFRQFLKDNLSRLVLDDGKRGQIEMIADRSEEFAAAAVRTILGVSSRAVMNRDGVPAVEARAKWRGLIGQYEDAVWGARR